MRASPGELLKTRSPGYLIQVEPEQIDVGRFERLAAEAREARWPGTPTQPRASRGACALAGHPLAEFTYESFARIEIAQPRGLRLAALMDGSTAPSHAGATRS